MVAIPKATTLEHLQANLEATELDLEDEHFFVIDEMEKDVRIVNPYFAPDWD